MVFLKIILYNSRKEIHRCKQGGTRMNICEKCGFAHSDENFCPKCGAPVKVNFGLNDSELVQNTVSNTKTENSDKSQKHINKKKTAMAAGVVALAIAIMAGARILTDKQNSSDGTKKVNDEVMVENVKTKDYTVKKQLPVGIFYMNSNGEVIDASDGEVLCDHVMNASIVYDIAVFYTSNDARYRYYTIEDEQPIEISEQDAVDRNSIMKTDSNVSVYEFPNGATIGAATLTSSGLEYTTSDGTVTQIGGEQASYLYLKMMATDDGKSVVIYAIDNSEDGTSNDTIYAVNEDGSIKYTCTLPTSEKADIDKRKIYKVDDDGSCVISTPKGICYVDASKQIITNAAYYSGEYGSRTNDCTIYDEKANTFITYSEAESKLSVMTVDSKSAMSNIIAYDIKGILAAANITPENIAPDTQGGRLVTGINGDNDNKYIVVRKENSGEYDFVNVATRDIISVKTTVERASMFYESDKYIVIQGVDSDYDKQSDRMVSKFAVIKKADMSVVYTGTRPLYSFFEQTALPFEIEEDTIIYDKSDDEIVFYNMSTGEEKQLMNNKISYFSKADISVDETDSGISNGIIIVTDKGIYYYSQIDGIVNITKEDYNTTDGNLAENSVISFSYFGHISEPVLCGRKIIYKKKNGELIVYDMDMKTEDVLASNIKEFYSLHR